MTLQFSDIPSTGEEPLRLGVANAARNAERFSPDPNFADNDPARGYGNGELRRRRDLGLEPIPGFPLRSRMAD